MMRAAARSSAFPAMIGALLMARAVDDEALSDEILAATRHHLAAAIEPEQ